MEPQRDSWSLNVTHAKGLTSLPPALWTLKTVPSSYRGPGDSELKVVDATLESSGPGSDSF